MWPCSSAEAGGCRASEAGQGWGAPGAGAREGGAGAPIGGYLGLATKPTARGWRNASRGWTIRGRTLGRLLEQAGGALDRGDREEAGRLLARFEEQATQALAEAVYQRSRLALDEVRYREAYGHARRAAWFALDNSRYLAGAGELARILGDYGVAGNYLEQVVLTDDLETYGKDHPEVARDCSNLGAVWQARGEYQKAIDYYEEALAANLKAYGEDHPEMARNRSDLGTA